ncbi:hypothetical protein ACT009_03700 [Sphingomonas sp. Tas61C01]|uniref:hypothetical protein n=1 Tax=Sphingomonas sp. Tas61C01 TaxID=3458297 RepID=UPI00403EDD15
MKDEFAYRLGRALEDLGSTLFVGTGGSATLGDESMPCRDILLTGDIMGNDAVPSPSVAPVVSVSASTLE